MKKILSLGVAAAVLSLTAVAASAAIAPTIINEAVEGEQITVEIVANGITANGTQFNVAASEGLTLDDTQTVKAAKGFSEWNGTKFVWADSAAPEDGTVLLTLVYTVDAAADEEISITLTPDAGFEADIDATPYAAVVVSGAPEVADPTVDTVVDTVDTSDVIVDTSDVVVDTVDTADTAETENVPTGIALAVVPAVLAGAAIVVAKKRS
ncbi:MAG: hypothetical protein IJZ47_06655 [Oscillospiraceae bacterium]|nr:hypothetical protein [Oscillospiraceae bacterium]